MTTPLPQDYTNRFNPTPGATDEIPADGPRGLNTITGRINANTAAIGIDVKRYGAKGDGITNDTTAIEAAWAAAYPANALYFPPGNYVYNGAGLDSAVLPGFGSVFIVQGAGEFATTITLGASSYLLTPSHPLSAFVLQDMRIEGGKGAVKHTWTGTDTIGTKHIYRVRFNAYTECAVATEASDSPFWFINECWFTGANATTTIGVALANGLTDGCAITKNNFQHNRVHLKGGAGVNNLYIHDNAFFHQATDTNGMRCCVWVIPSASSNNGGNGFTCDRNKFSSEMMATGDLFIVYADQLSGASNGTRMPNLAADSTGFVLGHTISENLFRPLDATLFDSSTVIPPIIYSTTPNVIGLTMPNNQIFDQIKYAIEFRTPPTVDFTNTGNVFGPFYRGSNRVTLGPRVSNDPAVGLIDDPGQLLQTRSTVARQAGSGSSAAFVELLTTAASAFSTSSATIAGTTDAFGGSDAATINITGDFGGAYATISNLIVGLPCWVELDVAQPADTPMSGVRVAIHQFTGNLQHWARVLEIPAATLGWVTYAFCFTPRGTGSGLTLGLLIGAPLSGTGLTGPDYRGKVKIGRPRVYQSHERVLGGRRPTVNAAATDATTTQALVNDLRAKLISLGIVK